MQRNIFKLLALWDHCPLHPCPLTQLKLSLHYTLISNGYFPFFLKDYKPNQNLNLSFNFFKLTFQHMLHLLANGYYGMVFEHLQDYFHLEDLANDYLNCFNFILISHRVTFHFELHVFRVAHLLAMTKPLNRVCPIIVGETLYQFRSCSLSLQIHNAFVTHLSLHQFKVAIKGNCEAIIYNIKCTLNLHLN
jgi:hypothetical protein